jgi:hypothetical protein
MDPLEDRAAHLADLLSVTWAFGPLVEMKIPATYHSERQREICLFFAAKADSSSRRSPE